MVSAATMTAETPRIHHQRPECVPSDANARLEMSVTSDSPIVSAKVFYRSSAHEGYPRYFYQMRRDPSGKFWAVLPLPESETKEVLYEFVAHNIDGTESRSATLRVPVRSNCRMPLTDEEKLYTENLVIGLTEDSQEVVPKGFQCVGVISKITTQGELMPHEECRKLLAYWYRRPVGLWIAGGAAVIAGGGIIVTGGGGPPVSPSRP